MPSGPRSDPPSQAQDWYNGSMQAGLDALLMSREEELAFLQANYNQLSLQVRSLLAIDSLLSGVAV